jgi:hypothetical protein
MEVSKGKFSASEMKSVFLEEYNSLKDGTHVEPVLEKDGPVHEAFLREYLGGTDDDLQNYYRALVFSGRGSMPKQLGSDAEVVAYVAKTKGSTGVRRTFMRRAIVSWKRLASSANYDADQQTTQG